MSQVKPNTLSEIAEVIRVLQTGGRVKVSPLAGYGPTETAQEVYVDGSLTYLPDFSGYRYDPEPREIDVVVMISRSTGRTVLALADRGDRPPADTYAYRYVKGKLTYGA